MASSNVLISEVEPDVRRLLVKLVERLGHEALVLRDDVVVPPRADVLLVEPLAASGIEHARLVRAFFPETPIVFLNPLPDDAGFLGRGPLFFLPKPFAPEALEEILEQALDSRSIPVSGEGPSTLVRMGVGSATAD
jgi:CheY-like chemotaxis protein